MNRWLYMLGGCAASFAAIRVAQNSGSFALEAGFACVVAAVLVSAGAIVGALQELRPKPISRDNGGKREE